MRDKKSYDRTRKLDSKYEGNQKRQSKKVLSHKKKKNVVPMALCFIIGVGIGWITEFDTIDFIENISQYKIAVVKKNNEYESMNSELSSHEESIDKNQESNAEKVTSNEIIKSETSNKEQELQQEKKDVAKETKQDKINKAKKSIINNCGNEWSDVVYTAEAAHPTKGGNYYIFNVGPDGMGDIQFYVDTNTYKVYEYSVDGYFGKYRNGNSSIFTYEMAVIKLENDLGWDEDRVFSLIKEKADGFIIRTAFITDGGSGKGETFYVTRDTIDIYTGY